ncbi:AMP-binding protein [Arcanobacterium haemolyticum]|nr:AMP-binding protein [Arcanobacterium haemolyticum]
MIDAVGEMTIPELVARQARERADAQALVVVNPDTEDVETLTYRELDVTTNRVANLFRSRGITRGDRIAVLAYNSREFVECLIGAAKIGAIIVPLNAAFTASECAYIINRCEVKLLVAEDGLLAQEGMADLAVPTLAIGAGRETYENLKNAQDAYLEPENVGPDDLVEIMFTSGTTSRPKGVMLTQANFIFSGVYVNWELSMTSEDRYLSAMSASHVNLQLSALMPALTSGSTLILLRRYSATKFWAHVRRFGATLIQAMAMVVRTLMLQPHAPGERDHRVREVHYFLPITEEEKAAFEDRFGVSLLNNYGSTESLVGVITDLPGEERHWPSIGKPGRGYEIRIVGSDGVDCVDGVCGEIWVHGVPGRTLMAGYWREPELTASTITDGWYHTGDWGYAKDGWIYFVDRHSDLIKRAGENVSASEVEDILAHCPGVAEVAVVGIPDEIRDEAIKAVVVPEPHSHVNVDDIRAYASRHLSYFKVPEIIEMRDELPRGEYGKVVKSALKAPMTCKEKGVFQ